LAVELQLICKAAGGKTSRAPARGASQFMHRAAAFPSTFSPASADKNARDSVADLRLNRHG
jgi:hypothetical protein